jgi:hypothetical protein
MHFFEEGTENIDPYFILLGHTQQLKELHDYRV